MSKLPTTKLSYGTLLENVGTLRVPYAWLAALRNHTAALLLADILAACSGQAVGRAVRWDGRELLLEYKQLALTLGVSVRSISRAIAVLAARKLVSYRRIDRVVKDTKHRNIVGVIPDLTAIARLSGLGGDAILAARAFKSPAPPSQTRSSVVDGVSAPNLTLSDGQEALLRAYKRIFFDEVGADYVVRSTQEHADQDSAAIIRVPASRGGGRRFLVWSEEYIQALRKKTEQEHGPVPDSAFDRHGHVRDRYTFEAFAAWVQSNEALPDGRSRRAFK